MKVDLLLKSFGLLILALCAVLPLRQSRAQDFTPPAVCQRTSDDIRALALNPDFRVSFDNDGGILNKGVCWWHARFQRAAWYLAEFQPEFPKPSRARATKIIDKIANISGFVAIPGYKNFKAFSKDFADLIQARLDDWQLSDATLGFAWFEGLTGETRLPAGTLLKRMDEIYDRVANGGEITFLKLQIPGLGAHAWLVVDMKGTSTGYEMKIIDNNYASKTYTINYKVGDEFMSLPYRKEHTFIPHIIYEEDLDRLYDVKRRDCR
ncbi:hypothetical protein WDW86_11660 [Bdellovibrionota bacterium FG-2]